MFAIIRKSAVAILLAAAALALVATAPAQAQNNVLRVTRLQMLKPGVRRLLPGAQFLTATGIYNLKTKAYSLDARANNFTLQHLALPSLVSSSRSLTELWTTGSPAGLTPFFIGMPAWLLPCSPFKKSY